jgi:glycosyltransferase involved in cell wall biosynthesis
MIKLLYLFDSYPVFYQPYINSVVDYFSAEQFYDLYVKSVSPTKPKFRKKLYSLVEKIRSKATNDSLSSLQKNLLIQDIVHVQHSYLFFHLYRISKEEKKPKLIITLRGADTYIKPLINKKWLSFYKKDFLDAYIVMSSDQKSKLQSWGVSPEKIHVIPISFGSPFLVQPKEIDNKKIKIVSAFRLCWEKNINGNLLVIKNLVENGIPVQYDIYGNGTEKKMLLYLIDKYQLKENVFCKGAIPNEELKSKLPDYNFYLQLSLSESFGMSVVEAQTYGLPAITSNVGGLPDIVVNDKTGFTVSPNDHKAAAEQLLKLWKEPKTYTEFSNNAIKHSQENFCTQKEVSMLNDLYKSLINGK